MKLLRDPLTGRTEDYLRGVYIIVERKGYARIKDIAGELGVQPSSASEMMKKLNRRGLVIYEKFGGVTLTPRGEEVAQAINQRHDTFTRFLQIILVPKDIALKDAHVLEHQLTHKTILQFARFVDFIEQSTERPGIIGRWRELFKSYCEREDADR